MIAAASAAGLRTAALILNSVFIFAGLFALMAALMGWKWFFTTTSARSLGGRSRLWARIFYGAAGAAILIAGIFGLLTNLA